jgi:hypothetical protein
MDFGEDLNILASIDDTDDVEDDMNGIHALFDECWNDSKSNNLTINFLILINIFSSGAVGIPHVEASPTRDSHRGSPTPMDDNRGGQTPGMVDLQSGSSRNLFSLQDQDEVSSTKNIL